LWIFNQTNVLYSQETHVTFWCPMRFERYPLDYQVKKYSNSIFKNILKSKLLFYLLIIFEEVP